MEFEKLKIAAKRIQMSDEMKDRVIKNSKEIILKLGEETVMKREKRNAFIRKPVVLCAVMAICLCLSAAAAASGVLQGFFRDVVDDRGAVVGTSYEQADGEIVLRASADENVLTALVSIADPQQPPYSEMEQLSIAAYRIVDANGGTAKEGAAGAVEILGGEAAFTISLEGMDTGCYTLEITAFTAQKKADQPLDIHGSWECVFSK